jgi:hypothetical protein
MIKLGKSSTTTSETLLVTSHSDRGNNSEDDSSPNSSAPASDEGGPACQSDKNGCRFEITIKIIEIAVAAFVGVLLVCVGYRQAGIMDTQTRMAQTEQRPWISLTEPKITSDFTMPDAKSNGGQISFSATIQNTGKLPAENVRPRVEAYVIGAHWVLDGRPDIVRDAVCKEQRQKPLTEGFSTAKLYGDVLFPGDKILHEEHLILGRDSIREAEDIRIWVIVCIDYKVIQKDGDRHQTSHIFLIRGANGKGVMWQGKTIPQGDLVMSWSIFGTLAD